MITGDHPRTAARIAGDLGIPGGGGSAVAGVEIDALGDEELRRMMREARSTRASRPSTSSGSCAPSRPTG